MGGSHDIGREERRKRRCDHPYRSVSTNQATVIDQNGDPVRTTEIEHCTDCRKILDTSGDSLELPATKNEVECPHPYDAVSEQDVELVFDDSDETTLSTSSVLVCTECSHRVEPVRLSPPRKLPHR